MSCCEISGEIYKKSRKNRKTIEKMIKIVKKIIKNRNENFNQNNKIENKNIEILYNKEKKIIHTHLTSNKINSLFCR